MEQKELKFDDFGVIVWVSAQLPLENVNIVWVWECQRRYCCRVSTFFKVRALKKGMKTERYKYRQNALRRGLRGVPVDPSKFVT